MPEDTATTVASLRRQHAWQRGAIDLLQSEFATALGLFDQVLGFRSWRLIRPFRVLSSLLHGTRRLLVEP